MRSEASASAPGKVVLSGEYAVLDGAPAVAMAVNRRAVVRVERGGQVSRVASAPDMSLVDTIVAAYDGAEAVLCECNTEAFFDSVSGAKLGLGSSAALTAALCAALRGDNDVTDRAMTLHREWQGGAGSGVDVACAAHGGLIEYQKENAVVTKLLWPTGLEFRLVWMGTASNTRDKLMKLAAHDRPGSMKGLATQSALVANAWRSGDAAAVLRAYPAFVDSLRDLSADRDLGVFDAGHDELVDIARADDIVYKPCGAGGGDIGIALSTDPGRLDDFVAAHRLYVVPCAFDPHGVSLEPSQIE